MLSNLKYFLQLLILVCLISCTSDVDFDQVEEIELNQNLTTSFIFLNVGQNVFLNTNASAEIPTFSNESNLDVFSSEYFVENLIRASFTFQIENNFDRIFEIELSFLNGSGTVTNSFNINASENNSFSHIQSFEGLDLLSLKSSKKLKITIDLLPSADSSILDRDEQMNLVVKSFTNLTFKVN